MADDSDDVPLNGPLEVGAEYDCFEALELRVVSWVNERTPDFRVVTADRTYRREDAKSEVRRRMYEADERTPAMVAADLSTATLRCSMHTEGCPFRVYATQSAPGAEWIVEAFDHAHSSHQPPAGRPPRGAAAGKRARETLAESGSSSSTEAEANDDGEYDESDGERPARRRKQASSDIEIVPSPKRSTSRPVAGPSKPRPAAKKSAPIPIDSRSVSPGPSGMPALGSHWPTLSSFESACRGAAKQTRPSFRVMGGKDSSRGLVRCEFYRAGCPFRILAPKNGMMNAFIVTEATYEHGHHPSKSAPPPKPPAPRRSPVRPAIDDRDSLGSDTSDIQLQPAPKSTTPAPPAAPIDLSAPIGPYLASLHPSLGPLAPTLVSGGLEDRVGELLALDREGILKDFVASLGDGVKPLERVRLLRHVAEECARHAAQLGAV